MNIYVVLGALVFLGVWLFLLLRPGKFLFLKQWQRIGAAVLSLGLVVLLFHTARKSEPSANQMLHVCWAGNQAIYVKASEDRCAPEELHNAGPGLVVLWDLDSSYDVHKKYFQDSLDYWNKGIGYQAFSEPRFNEAWTSADVIITSCTSADTPMSTSHFKVEDGSTRAHICVRPGLHDLRLFYLSMQHELGHVLGLAHDYHGSSIMREDVLDADQRRMQVWIITQEDKDVLRKISSNH